MIITITDFTITTDGITFTHNEQEYVVLKKDICDAIASEKYKLSEKSNSTAKMIKSFEISGYRTALLDYCIDDIIKKMKKFDVYECNFHLGRLVTYNMNNVEPYNIIINK